MNIKPYYPIGIQDFEKIRDRHAVYVDKTALVYELTHTSDFVFLSRPRRFGKSLLSSTLQRYFEGRKDLFTGLAMEKLEEEWNTYPVLHFDLSTARSQSLDQVSDDLSDQLEIMERRYGLDKGNKNFGRRLKAIILQAYEQTGRPVVVIVDEYDAPILEMLNDAEKYDAVRHILRELYTPLKACDSYLRFVFITGISTFSQLGIFSELNNLRNISTDRAFASICGITHQELLDNFQLGISQLAEDWNCNEEEVVEKLTLNYDGYHFCKKSEGIFNPYSLLNAFNSKDISDYWFQSGTSRYLVDVLKRYIEKGEFGLSMMEEQHNLDASSFNTPLEAMSGPLPLLYQSGYLTIKGYDEESDLYTLDIPNAEVRVGLMKNLLPLYANVNADDFKGTASLASTCLRKGNYEGALKLLQSLLAGLPYLRGDTDILVDAEKTEAYYHRLFYFFFRMLRNEVFAEVRNAVGSCDIVAFTPQYIYIIEIKIDADPQVALNQIEDKGYAKPYLTDSREIIKVGVSFSTRTRTIESWKKGE
jgi:hypothetical protein